ncbi:hypothetical protein QR680_013268 [Steinernema hermaphroditum]|uniref:Uncharacterized protein n=1 Tax=Steinernema hermaphroditum TaxID=289476 RepID=A0AA39I7J3_9BILA|nr:hypothetical protein QR680_013268 [Steinernema hermaphroditum]
MMGVVDQGIVVLTNGTFLSTKDTSTGYDGEEGISAEEKQKLFWPMYSHLNNVLIQPMDRLQLDQVNTSEAIIKDFHDYYKDREDDSDGSEVRMGTIILFIGSLFRNTLGGTELADKHSPDPHYDKCRRDTFKTVIETFLIFFRGVVDCDLRLP